MAGKRAAGHPCAKGMAGGLNRFPPQDAPYQAMVR